VGLEKKLFKGKVNRRTDGQTDGQTDTGQIAMAIAFSSGELNNTWKKYTCINIHLLYTCIFKKKKPSQHFQKFQHDD